MTQLCKFRFDYDADSIAGKMDLVARRTMKLPLGEWNWGDGVALLGLFRAWEVSGEADYLQYCKNWVGANFPSTELPVTVNGTIPTYIAALVHAEYPDEASYMELAHRVARFLLHDNERLNNGALVHTDTLLDQQTQLWVDTLFVAGIYLAYAGTRFGEPAWVDEAVNQFHVHMEALQCEDGLCFHGYDDATGKPIGTRWARGNAWIIAGYPNLMERVPPSEPRRKSIDRRFERLAEALLQCQDMTGAWHTVLDQPSTYLETSATAGIAYGLLKARRLGLLATDRYDGMIERALLWLLTHIEEDGTVSRVSAGTPVLPNYVVYNEISDHRIQRWGQGLALMALSEWVLGLPAKDATINR